MYACHVPAAQMRTNPIGTGPFKFVELRAEQIDQADVKNPDYWKKGLPYLHDGIEYTILPNRSTAILAQRLSPSKFDISFPTEVSLPLIKDVKSQKPEMVCTIAQTNVATSLITSSRDAAPGFNDEGNPPRVGTLARPQGIPRHSARRASPPSPVRCCRLRTACGVFRRTNSRPSSAMATT